MSYQRACVNCDRCYELSQKLEEKFNPGHINDAGHIIYGRSIDPTPFAKYLQHASQQRQMARNSAMSALEHVISEVANEHAQDDRDQALLCLDACVACDYSKPAILECLKARKSESERHEDRAK